MADYLLLQDGDYLLLQGGDVDGGRLILSLAPEPPDPSTAFVGTMWYASGTVGEGSAYNLAELNDWSIDPYNSDIVHARFNAWTCGEMTHQSDLSPVVAFDRHAFESAVRYLQPYANIRSLEFDGVEESVTLNFNPGYLGAEFTINMWVKTTATEGSLFGGRTNPPRVCFGIDDSRVSVSSSAGVYQTAVDAGDFRDGAWHLLSLTADSAGIDKVYIDAVDTPWDVVTGSIDSFFDSGGYYIGRCVVGPRYEGLIDETSVFNTNLSAAEIAEVYNAGVPDDMLTHSRSANLTGWWRMGDIDNAPDLYEVLTGDASTMANMDNTNFKHDVPS